jgi:steroid delta-isomerase-like uncharacterized protein
MNKSIHHAIFSFTIAFGAAGAFVSVAAHGEELKPAPSGVAVAAGASHKRTTHVTAEANKRTMERFTREFLRTGDKALGAQFISPDILLHFAGQQFRGRDTYLGIVAANQAAFPDLVWTVNHMVADGDTVAIRYTMTGTQRGTFAGVPASNKPVTAESMAFYRLVGGKIVEERAQLDMLSVFQQIGTVPGAK